MLITMSASTQYLQVPKPLHTRKSRSRSKTRPVDMPREVLHSTQVIVSPIKLSFKPPQSPPPPSLQPAASPPIPSSPIFEKEPAVVVRDIPDADFDMPDAILPMSIHSPPPSPGGTNYDDLNEGLYTLEKCVTPPPEIPLREKLIGAWKLESYVAHPTPQSRIQRDTYPMTRNVTGFIMYTPDGYLSATMLIPGQSSFKRGEGEEAQWAEAGKRCFTYCGPYFITDEGPDRSEVLRHTFQCCNLPGWIGDIQIRTHRFEEDGQVLVLGSEEPTEVKGDKRIPVLKWRRARDNREGSPPPPTPQIKISGPGEPSQRRSSTLSPDVVQDRVGRHH